MNRKGYCPECDCDLEYGERDYPTKGEYTIEVYCPYCFWSGLEWYSIEDDEYLETQ